MKIGIITYHRSFNYGALLQAIALRYYLTKSGNNVSYIDYWPKFHKKQYIPFSFEKFKDYDGIRGKLAYIKGYFSRSRRYHSIDKVFRQFIKPYLSSMSEEYDLIIYGSDQIWRKQVDTNTYDPVYFGENTKSFIKVSYAASMGSISLSSNDKLVLRNLLSNFKRISVREDDLMELVKDLGYPCEKHIDPTFLLSQREWRSVLNLNSSKKEPYVLHYNLLGDSFDSKKIMEYAAQRGLKVITLYGKVVNHKKEGELDNANPKQFLELIQGADFIFSSSFHGLAFAIIFHKQFLVSFNTNSTRAESLLSSMNLSERLLKPKSDIPELPNIIYDKVDLLLNEQREKAFTYLQELTISRL